MKKLLLDTQPIIMSMNGDKISPRAQKAILSQSENVYISVASIWEMAIKLSLGKLTLPMSLDQMIPQVLQETGIRLLAIETEHVFSVAHMPFHHKDPFDRLLVAQAQKEKMAVVSSDVAFDSYSIERIW